MSRNKVMIMAIGFYVDFFKCFFCMLYVIVMISDVNPKVFFFLMLKSWIF